jgi:hypothetical protein
MNLGCQFATLGANVLTFINIVDVLPFLLLLGVKQQAKNAQSWPKFFPTLTPSLEWA